MQLGLFQKQTTDLIITPELRQAIGLLQYNTTELMQFIQDQAIENPLIELEDLEKDYPIEEAFLPQNEKIQIHRHNDYVNPIDYAAQSENHSLESILEQVGCLVIKDDKRAILEYIVLNLDDDGYLSMSVVELAEQLDISEAKIETCLSYLQQFEPIGLGARDIEECLLLQATYYFPDNKVIHRIIRNHLNDLAAKKWQDIAETMSITLMDVNDAANLIATLNPKPCVNLFHSEPAFLFPDIIINDDYGMYTITLSDSYLPKIKLNQDYLNLQNSSPQASSYIKLNYKNYLWMINSIEQRQSTIMKIARTIIRRQSEFLKYGFSHLKPMTMRDIAEEIEMHESTVSRATRNKVIRTPVGSFEMNKLFSAKFKQNNIEYASSTQVKLLLKQAINQENPKRPLSDQKLVEILRDRKGITISRRTIAKYREELHILSSTRRKQVV